MTAAVAHARRQLQSLGLSEAQALALLLPVLAETYREVADDADDGAHISNVWGDTPSEALHNFATAYRKVAADCDLPGATVPPEAGARRRVRDLHRPVTLMGQVWCDECSTQRQTGPREAERVAFIPHPCRTIRALDGEAL